MNILLLSLYFRPDVAANAVIMTELVEELLERGHEVTVVTAFPHYAQNVTQPKYRGKIFQKEESEGLTIIRTYLYTSPEKQRFLVRLFNYASYNILSTLAALFTGQQDVIIAPSPPLTVGLSAAIIGFFKRIPYIYNVQDINPDVLIKLGILKNNLIIQFSKWLEKFVYTRAEHITVLSEGFRQNLVKKGVPDHKISVIPNFIDPNFIQPLPKDNSFREEHELQSDFLITYAGNLGHSQYLEVLLESARRLEDKGRFTFLVVGNGSRKAELKKLAQDDQLSNVHFLPFQPRERVPEIYAAADICVVTLKSGIAMDSVPSKAYTIMASSRPVLAAVDRGSDTWKLIQEAACGVCVEPEDPEAFTEAILSMSSQPALLEKFGKNGREYVLRHHTREVIGQKYDRLLRANF